MTENMNINAADEPMVDVSSESTNDLYTSPVDVVPQVVDSAKQQSDVDDDDDDDDDDRSTVVIGEIDVDEYFDDVYVDLGVFGGDFADEDVAAPGGSSSVVGNANDDDDDSHAADLSNLFQHASVAARNENVTHVANPGIISYPPRAAAVKANACIANGGAAAKRKRPPCGENREQQASKYRMIERHANVNQKKTFLLKDFGIVVPSLFYQIFLQDKHCLMDDNFILRLPATPTVYDILTAYSRNKSIDHDLNIFLETFDMALPKWCLYRIEQLQYENIIGKFPTLRMSQIYGLSHLIRFISCLPKLFKEFIQYRDTFIKNISMFVSGFLNYMVEANININFDRDYDNVMPDYYRMTYWPKRTKRLFEP